MYDLKNRIAKQIEQLQRKIYHREDVQSITVRQGKIDFPCDVQSINDEFQPFENGAVWSQPGFDDYALFRFDVVVPEEYEGKTLCLDIRTNKGFEIHNMLRPQMLLYVNGEEYQGIDTNHTLARLTTCAVAGQIYHIDLYAYSGSPVRSPFATFVDMDLTEGTRLYVSCAVENRIVRELMYDLTVPAVYAEKLPHGSYEERKIVHSINDALDCLDYRSEDDAFMEQMQQAKVVLKKLYGRFPDMEQTCLVVGHTHIDIAWLWRFCHTREKASRSFATALRLLEQYPEYRFMSSQAQLYEYIRQDHPQMFERIQQKVQEGRWEVEGAMWLEPDMNLASGETIVRQILYGKTYFKKHFDVDSKVLWLPDVFGYSAALPQILRLCGVKYFSTSKMYMNDTNPFPADTFIWKGIDGTGVFSHILTYCGYAPSVENGSVIDAHRQYKQKELNSDLLIPCGFADGGGGTTERQIENILRTGKGIPGVPNCRFGTVGAYFAQLEQKLGTGKALPTWSGEIYLEYHRGTLTSMARNKLYNRRSEDMLSDYEWLGVLAAQLWKKNYDKKLFDDNMKKCLLCQFHDVLPGSSIEAVYEDSDKLYESLFEEIGGGVDETKKYIASNAAGEGTFAVFNSWGEPVEGYAIVDGKPLWFENVPAKGYAVSDPQQKSSFGLISATTECIENDFYIIRFDTDGSICSLYDKKVKRECFQQETRANKLRIFEDMPYIEDNWNLEKYYRRKEYDLGAPQSIYIAEADEEHVVLRTERNYMRSKIVQDTVIYRRMPRIDFVTQLDWKEHNQVLRTYFPVDVNCDSAAYEIQFGYVKRPTNQNTSWEQAKFEVCGHRWADVSDGGYGMALLNDCKYGYAAEGAELSLTLLRCGTVPNEHADEGLHRFTYSILPHEGTIEQAALMKEGWLLNRPLTAYRHIGQGDLPTNFSAAQCTGAVLDTVKPSEDGKSIIYRMYEGYNRQTTVNLHLPYDTRGRRVYRTDLLEAPMQKPLEVDGQDISFTIRPFEIVTIAVENDFIEKEDG